MKKISCNNSEVIEINPICPPGLSGMMISLIIFYGERECLHKIIRIFSFFEAEVTMDVWKYYRCTRRKGGTCGK